MTKYKPSTLFWDGVSIIEGDGRLMTDTVTCQVRGCDNHTLLKVLVGYCLTASPACHLTTFKLAELYIRIVMDL